ncbi:MAG: 5'-nucleotidase C-terminal domain-containing protein [Prevotella sp.]|nr:5'-nucleotidase C-terminal domain-containing protein [Prevotella sp.]
MRNKYLLIATFCVLMMAACRSSYRVTGIERTRVLIDDRYDGAITEELKTYIAPFKASVDSVRKPVVGRSARYLSAYRPESPLSNLLPDILVWGAAKFDEHPDFGVYNIGGMRAAFAEGTITFGDVMEVAPFENKICFLTLSGEKVLELFRQIVGRGGEGVSSSVQLTARASDRQLVQACINGDEVDPVKKYRVVTIDYVAQGNDDMTAFKAGTDVLMPKAEENNVRYVISSYFKEKLQRGEAVDAKVEGRIVMN